MKPDDVVKGILLFLSALAFAWLLLTYAPLVFL
jgi:hypothetical protein